MPRDRRIDKVRYPKVAKLGLGSLRTALSLPGRLSLSDMAEHFGLGERGRETVGKWERGEARCNERHRERWVTWLGDRLDQSPEHIKRVWGAFVEDWGWEPLSELELAIETGRVETSPLDTMATPLLIRSDGWSRERTAHRGPFDQAGSNSISSELLASLLSNSHLIFPEAENLLTSPTTSHQLRAPLSTFHGRSEELNQITHIITQTFQKSDRAAVVAVVGMPGIGKTELVLKAAHFLSHAAEIQLPVALRGKTLTPSTPVQALRDALRLLDPRASIVDDLEILQARYRGLLAGKRALILADDASDAAQVRALLPPTGCALVVTSRNRLVVPGMTVLEVPVLRDGAEALLRELCPRIGRHADRLARICGYLPLALAISASELSANDDRDVETYISELETARLRMLRDSENPDDTEVSVEASLQLSYAGLDETTQETLCQLSVFEESFDLEAARSIVHLRQESILESTIERLRRRSLLLWDAQNLRYVLHDLVRDFAAARLVDATLARWRHTTYYCSLVMKLAVQSETGGTVLLSALNQFDQERRNFDSACWWLLNQKPDSRGDTLLLQMRPFMGSIVMLRYGADERRALVEGWLAAAQRQGDLVAEAHASGHIGIILLQQERPGEALPFLRRWYNISRQVQDHELEVRSILSLGSAYATVGRNKAAMAYYRRGLAIAAAHKNYLLEGLFRNNIGVLLRITGNIRDSWTFAKSNLT